MVVVNDDFQFGSVFLLAYGVQAVTNVVRFVAGWDENRDPQRRRPRLRKHSKLLEVPHTVHRTRNCQRRTSDGRELPCPSPELAGSHLAFVIDGPPTGTR